MSRLRALGILALPVTLTMTLTLALVLSVASGRQAPAAGVYTTDQANAGRATFQSTCAACHQPDLRGSMDAPPLAGNNFVNAWNTRTTADLFSRIRYTMPANNPGSLSDQDAVNLTAFILQSNGAPAGTTPFAATVAVPIVSVAKAAPAGSAAQAATKPPPPPSDNATPRRAAAPATGVTIEGEVRNYVPGYQRNAGSSRSERLADDSRELSGLEPQSSHTDQHAKRA